MSNQTQAEKQIVSSHDAAVSSSVPDYNFEQWAGAVRQQMLAALKKREGNRGALS